jgi:ribosomal-protein-alanine acetyltransferase
MPAIRRGEPADFDPIRRIQAASLEAARWDPADYLRYDLRVAICENRVAGFLVTRSLGGQEGPQECEILNLAVAPETRRRGIARRLLEDFLGGFSGVVYLEVRESNQGARSFYNSMKFKEVGRRPEYYLSPMEDAIVMKFHSC